jgi:DNA topoisomerase IA
MTLLRGLGVEELTQPALTGGWEYQLSQMERGRIPRSSFMQEISQMTQRIVKRAKEFDSDKQYLATTSRLKLLVQLCWASKRKLSSFLL